MSEMKSRRKAALGLAVAKADVQTICSSALGHEKARGNKTEEKSSVFPIPLNVPVILFSF